MRLQADFLHIASGPAIGVGGEMAIEKAWIVGAGVMGLCVARELAQRQVQVTLLESGRVGEGASSAATGFLSLPPGGASPWMELRRRSWEYYPGFLEALSREGGKAVPLLPLGALYLHPETPLKKDRIDSNYNSGGHQVRWLEREAICDVIPGYQGADEVAMELKEEGVVDPRQLLVALKASCQALGVSIEEGCGEIEIGLGDLGEVRLQGRGSDQPLGSGEVAIVCGGWQSEKMTRQLPLAPIPLAPVQGEALALALESPPRRIIHFKDERGARFQMAPTPDGTTWLGSTVGEEGSCSGRTREGLETLLRAVRCLLPSVTSDDVCRHWSGIRPKATRRGGPLLCQWPQLSRLWLATGHYRNGIGCAPWSARLLVGAILSGDEVVEGFGWNADSGAIPGF